jgi:hypothetical protein
MPILIFEIPSFTYEAAAPEEVAITAIREVPTAYFILMPKPKVKSGMITTPPPRPVNAPNKPAAKELPKTIKVKSKLLKVNFLNQKPDTNNYKKLKYNFKLFFQNIIVRINCINAN